MRKTIYLSLLLLFSITGVWAQTTQTIKGTVIDKDTQQPLIGATISVLNLEPILGTVSDLDGNFAIENVPVGRHKIECNYLGYELFVSDNIILNSAKEVVLNIALVEGAILANEVVVKAFKHGNEALNELAVVSTRSFSVEETQRYASSANDPGRMAMGFPGVQPARDSRSDIVIRGNSTVGLLWRLEGIDIPNPNHFARRGTSGGGITIFSVSMLSNSDFSVGAFPAEYGNAFSGVFDVKFRKGNKEKREYTIRAGLLGLDFSTEGPIKKGKSSYLLNYRYSTLGILNQLGLHLVGERINNNFQDLSFKLTFPSENNKSIIDVWGIGGLSLEKGSTVDGVENWKSYSDYTTYDFETNMGALGMTHTYLIDDKSYLKTSLAAMGQQVVVQDDTLSVAQESGLVNIEDYTNGRYTLTSVYSRKFSPKLTMKTGFFASNLNYDLRQDSLNFESQEIRSILNVQGNTFLLQPYTQFRYRPHPQWSVNFGVHMMLLSLNNSNSVEPRLGIRYQIDDKQSLSLAYGLHGRMLPIGSYFTQVEDNLGNISLPNQDLDLIKAHHFVLAYDKLFGNSLRFHVEAYYQSLFNVPIVDDLDRTYWMLNDVQGYAHEALVSKGKGTNMGLDVSIEKIFLEGTFFILSASLFDSKYKALDDSRTFNTQYNSNYTATFLGGKEWKVGAKGTIQTGLKLLYNGGLRITPLQENAVNTNARQPILDESRAFSERVPAYFRPDLRIAYRSDNARNAWWIALDIQNIIGRRNIDGLNRTYDPDLQAWVDREQSSLVPVLSFQIDF